MRYIKHLARWFKQREWVTSRKFSLVVLGIVVVIFVWGSMLQHDSFDLHYLFLDLWSNFGTELAGIVVTVLIIDSLNQRRAIKQEKDALVLQMGSPNNAFAVEAARILRMHGWGWHEEKTLVEQRFPFADLSQANLSWCNLQRAKFERANLMGANLQYSNLQDADLSEANLEEVSFLGANLENSSLNRANLQRASFGPFLPENVNFTLLQYFDSTGRKSLDRKKDDKVNLRKASLFKANLQGADFTSAILEDTDMAEVNLKGATQGVGRSLSYEKLANVERLWRATMPDGKIYDGRLNLKGDIDFAQRAMVNINDPLKMAEWYEVSLEDYQAGQEWAKQNLPDTDK